MVTTCFQKSRPPSTAHSRHSARRRLASCRPCSTGHSNIPRCARRQQFGRPLSANQVIRHRLADMAMQCDEARSMALRAALMLDAEPVARSRAASGAKAKIGKCARFVAEQSVQLHGAMGVTEELDIGAYFKRLLAFETLFGGSAHHYRRHAALGGRPIQA